MPAEYAPLQQNGPKFQPPTMPPQGTSRSQSQARKGDERGPPGDSLTNKDGENQQPQPQQQQPLVTYEQKKFIKRYRTEVAASASSVLSTLATFPLDSVKTRMQTYKYNGFVDCVRHTYETEKLRGFFRGSYHKHSSTTKPIGLQLGTALAYDANILVLWLRRDGTLGKHHSCPNRLLFDLPTLQIRLLGLAQTKLRH